MENIRLGSAKNIRDLGGMKTADGRTVKPFRFLRGGSLSNLKPEDIEILKNRYHLKAVIDLRSKEEQLLKPDVNINGVMHYGIPIDDDTQSIIPKDIKTGIAPGPDIYANEQEDLPAIYHQYAGLVRSSYSVSQLKKVIHTIIDARNCGGSVLFHCFLGKDRTGLVAMLLLALLGVSREDIVADYSFTPVWHRKALELSLITLLKAKSLTAAKEFYREFLADPSYITHVFRVLISDYGSVEEFLRTNLDISNELREEFRNASLE